jgi:hypothetical protein
MRDELNELLTYEMALNVVVAENSGLAVGFGSPSAIIFEEHPDI